MCEKILSSFFQRIAFEMNQRLLWNVILIYCLGLNSWHNSFCPYFIGYNWVVDDRKDHQQTFPCIVAHFS